MLQVRLFGSFEIQSPLGPVPSPARRDTLRLWQYLLLHRSMPSSRDAIAAALWPDAPVDKARGYLRINLHALIALLTERAPDANWLRRDGRTIQWDSAAPAWIDLEEFDTLGRRIALISGGAPNSNTDDLERMVALYRGELLAGIAEDWVVPSRAHARSSVAQALGLLATAQDAGGLLDASATSLQRLLATDPLNESAARRLMTLFARSGERTHALEVFHQLSEALRAALDVGPSAETADLAGQIRSDTHPAAPSPAAFGATAVRLPTPISRFIGRREQITELIGLVGTERLVTVLGPGGAGKTRLGLEVAHRVAGSFAHGVWFIDLTRLTLGGDPWPEVARGLGIPASSGLTAQDSVCRHLADRQALLVMDNCEHVLRGIGRLSIELLTSAPAVRILATSRSPLGIEGEYRWAIPPLGLPAEDVTPSAAADQAEAVQLFVERVRAIRSHYTPSADDARAIRTICRRVDGLPLAIELAAARSNVLSISDLAHRLADGFRLLRLDSASLPERHRTIDACIDWSYRLVDASEQRLLGLLSVFPSTFTLAAAEGVGEDAAGGGDRPPVLDSLGKLLDVGLVAISDEPADTRRFRLLQPIQTHAHARANVDDLLAAKGRHAAYFLARAEAVQQRLYGNRDGDLESELDREIPDFRAALDTWVDSGQLERALQLCGAIWRLWYMRGHCEYERSRLEAILAQRIDGVPSQSVGRAAMAAGALAYRFGDHKSAERHFESAVTWLGQTSDRDGRMRSLEYLGIVYTVRGEPQKAEGTFQQLIEVIGDEADQGRRVNARHRLAQMQAWQGDLPTARVTLSECVRLADAVSVEQALDLKQSLATVLYSLGAFGEARVHATQGLIDADHIGRQRRRLRWQTLDGLIATATGQLDAASTTFRNVAADYRDEGEALALARTFHNLAEVSLAQGDYPTARTYLTESRRQKVDVNDQWGLVYTDIGLATLAHETGAFDEALAAANAAVADARERQDKCLIAWALQTAARAAIALGRLDEAAAALGECAALLTITCERRRISMALERAAMLANARGEHAAAARCLGAAEAIRTAIGSPPTHGEAADREACVAAVRAAVGDAAFEAGVDAGRQLSQADALAMIARLCEDLALSA